MKKTLALCVALALVAMVCAPARAQTWTIQTPTAQSLASTVTLPSTGSTLSGGPFTVNPGSTYDFSFITDSNSTFQVGDGTYSWGHSPEVGIEGIGEADALWYFDAGLYSDTIWSIGNAMNIRTPAGNTTSGLSVVPVTSYSRTTGAIRPFAVSVTYAPTSGDSTPATVAILPTYQQTGTHANTDLLINRTETSLGTGAQYLIDAQVATATKFSVDNKGLVRKAVSAAITADTGSAQGGSPLTAPLNVITVCGTTGDSVTLPAAAAGKEVRILNVAANSADVFPATDDAINEGSANAAKALAADAEMFCWSYDDTNWECRISAAR